MRTISVASVLTFLMLAAVMPRADAQTVTGSLTGTVVDSAGALVAGAQVDLTNEISKQVRQYQTTDNGVFIFPDLVPADYDLRITHPGFKA
ncbi:MAG: carboxypeptidase-like regulatory domain-containing protein, partial [Bryobacteraceae bacterium]